jgi:hypothetical protein
MRSFSVRETRARRRGIRAPERYGTSPSNPNGTNLDCKIMIYILMKLLTVYLRYKLIIYLPITYGNEQTSARINCIKKLFNTSS